MSENNDIFAKIKKIGGITDISENVEGPITNPTQLLIGEKARRMLFLCLGKTRVKISEMSDYEIFEAFLNNIVLLSGSGVREFFCLGMKEFFDIDVLSEKKSAKELWSETCRIIEEQSVKSVCCEKKQIFGALRAEKDLYSFIEGESKSFSKSCFMDISDFSFIKSDKYHTENAYTAYCQNRKYDRDLLLSGVDFLLLEKIKDSNICLDIYIGDNVVSAEKMLEYLLSRGVLPNCRLIANAKHIYETALVADRISSRCDFEKQINCGLAFDADFSSAIVASEIKKLASVYPLGKLKLFTSRKKSPNHLVAELILKQGLSIALNDFCENVEEAISIGENILS